MKFLNLILFVVLFSLCKTSIAQAWKDEFNTGVNLSKKSNYKEAIVKLLKSKNSFDADSLSNDYAVILYAIGDTYFNIENYDSSFYYLEKSSELHKHLLNENSPQYEAVLSKMGLVKYRINDYKQALEYFEKDVVLSEIIYENNSKEYMIAASNLANTFNKLKKYTEAEKYYIIVLKLKEHLFGKLGTEYSSTLNWLATLYMTTKNYMKAEPICIEAIEIRKQLSGTNNQYYITDVKRLATLYYEIGDLQNAEKFYIDAINVSKETSGENNSDYFSLLYDLGNIYLRSGNYTKAETLFLSSVTKIQDSLGKENLSYTNAVTILGLIYLETANYEKAELYLSEAWDIIGKECSKEKSKENFYKLGAACGNYAEFLRRTKNEDAQKFYELALKLYKISDDTLGYGYAAAINNLSILYTEIGENKKAELFLLKALQITKINKGERSSEYASVLRNTGTFFLTLDIDKAEFYLLASQALMKEKCSNNDPDYTYLFNSLSILYNKKNNQLLNTHYKIELIKLVNKLIENCTYFMSATMLEDYFYENAPEFLKFNDYLSKYSKQFSNLNGQSYNNELQNKGLILKNIQQVQNAVLKSGDTALVNTLESLRNIKNRLSQYYSLPKENRPSNMDELENKAEQLEKKLVQSSQPFRNLKEVFSITWKDVQNKLSANEVAVEFIRFPYFNKNWTDSIMYGALVLKAGYTEPHFVQLFEQKQLEALLNKKSNTTDSSYINNLYQYPTGKALQQLIWKPLDSLMNGVTTVYLAPSGLLHNINFSSLPVSNNQFLGQQYQIHILGTTGDIVKRKEQFINNSTISKSYLFGGIDYDKTSNTIAKTKVENNINFNLVTNTRGGNSSWSFLKNTLFETAAVDSLCKQNKINSEFISGSAASETTFKNISGETYPYILHLATHGYFFPDLKKNLDDKALLFSGSKQETIKMSDNPLLRSGLIFSGANKTWNTPSNSIDSTDDGILTAYEISNLDLSGAKLVVMSACKTGLGDVKGSEGVFGLQRSFKMAGANNIVMSLWDVPDAQTKELMKLFYENCFAGMPVSTALQNAQFTMSKKYSPYYWAAFKLLE